jgi:hypothetical protein
MMTAHLASSTGAWCVDGHTVYEAHGTAIRERPVAQWYEPLAVWRAWGDHVQGEPIAAEHVLAEEASEETVRL